MRTIKVFYAVMAIVILTWPISIAMNVFLINHVDKMQYHIDVRDSLLDKSNEQFYDFNETVDSLNKAVLDYLKAEGCR